MIDTRALTNAAMGVLALYYATGKKPPELLVFWALMATSVQLAVEVPKIFQGPGTGKMGGYGGGCGCGGKPHPWG